MKHVKSVAAETHQNAGGSQSAKTEAPKKPLRREFYKTVVVASNGAVVAESDWKKDLPEGSTTTRAINKALKAKGLQRVNLFQNDEYRKAQTAYREHRAKSQQEERKNIIGQAFEQADLEPNARLENVLSQLLPSFRDTPVKRTVTAMRNIINIVARNSNLYKGGEAEDAGAEQKETVH